MSLEINKLFLQVHILRGFPKKTGRSMNRYYQGHVTNCGSTARDRHNQFYTSTARSVACMTFASEPIPTSVIPSTHPYTTCELCVNSCQLSPCPTRVRLCPLLRDAEKSMCAQSMIKSEETKPTRAKPAMNNADPTQTSCRTNTENPAVAKSRIERGKPGHANDLTDATRPKLEKSNKEGRKPECE